MTPKVGPETTTTRSPDVAPEWHALLFAENLPVGGCRRLQSGQKGSIGRGRHFIEYRSQFGDVFNGIFLQEYKQSGIGNVTRAPSTLRAVGRGLSNAAGFHPTYRYCGGYR